MKIIKSSDRMQALSKRLWGERITIGFVPTMGALHRGHLSLIERARKGNDVVVVSIFVNPTQFGPGEDYLRYPRTFEADKKICKSSGVDYVFVPDARDMYGQTHLTYVNVENMSDILCGKFRPGHFKGVATIVAKLFNIVMPTRAYFGSKDYQQLAIIKQMTKDLNFPVNIIACPTVRESSGLALSSRNRYLSPVEHARSAKIAQSLQLSSMLVKNKKFRDSKKIIDSMADIIKTIPGAVIDYICISDTETLQPVLHIKKDVLASIAVRVGKTRLIDNMILRLNKLRKNVSL